MEVTEKWTKNVKSKLGRRIKRGWVSHRYRFYPKGRLKLVLYSTPKTLIGNSLPGLNNQRMEFRTTTDPGKFRGWNLRKKWARKGKLQILCVNSAQVSEPYMNRAYSNTSAKDKRTEQRFELLPRKKCLQFKFGQLNLPMKKRNN